MKDRARRLELCEKSLKAFGVKYRWQTIMRKGQLIDTNETVTVRGKPRPIKRWLPVYVQQVEKAMDLIIQEKEKAREARATRDDNTDGQEIRPGEGGPDVHAESGD